MTCKLLADLADGQDLQIDPAVLRRLQTYRWPGNLRQYSQILKTAMALLDSHESQITWAHLPDDLVLALQDPVTSSQEVPVQNLQQLSRKAIQLALENARGNVSAAARQLGISRQTLYRKLQDRTALH